MFPYIGRSIEVTYETGYHFRIDYLSADTLRWTSLAQRSDGAPTTGEETFQLHPISASIFMLTWVETTGITVAQVLDFTTMEVYAVMTWAESSARGGRDTLAHSGVINIMR